MDFFKYFSYYSQKMMISPYYFGPPILIDPVDTSKTHSTSFSLEVSTVTYCTIFFAIR
jgi:hypothetical protein